MVRPYPKSVLCAAAALALTMGVPDPGTPSPGRGDAGAAPAAGSASPLLNIASRARLTGLFDPTAAIPARVHEIIEAGNCGGRIGDRIWHDADKDGIQDPEEKGLSGVIVFLLSGSGQRMGITRTDINGRYLFSGLCDGTYIVRVNEKTLPGGFQQTPTQAGTDPALDGNPNPSLVDLTTDAGADPTQDFGYQCARTDEDEGCTPGYWKQPHHFDSWPYDPNTPFSAFFDDAFPGKSLLQVLKQGGGGKKALGRHTVAALLNASAAGVGYNMSHQDVVDTFNDVFPGTDTEYENIKNGFAALNEMGCPLN